MADDGKDLRDKSLEHVEGSHLPPSSSLLTQNQDKIFNLNNDDLLVDLTDLSCDNKYQILNKNVLDTNSFTNSSSSSSEESKLTANARSSISAPSLTSTHHNASSVLNANVQAIQGLTLSDQTTVPTSHPTGTLSPTSLRVNPFNAPNAESRQLGATDDTAFDPLAFGDPTFISTYFTSSPGHEEYQRTRSRVPQHEGFAGAVPVLAPPHRANQFAASATHLTGPTSQSASPGRRLAPSNQNTGPVVLQDYTGNFAPGRTQVFKPTTDSKGVNLAEVVPHVEIIGYPGNMQGLSGRGPDPGVGNVAQARQLFAYDDGADDEMYMHEDAPLLDSQSAAAQSPRHGGGGGGRPSKWSRGARDEAGIASAGLKKERGSFATPVLVVVGDMTSNGEVDSLRDNARGVASHNGSIDHRLADKPQLPGNTVWQRNSYGHLSPTPPEELPSTAAYRHCHRKKCASLTDRLALRQLIAVVVLCLLFMAGEAIGGALSNSLALFTDVLHLGSDLISFIISLFAMWLAKKPASKKMSFGYHRAEVMGALVSVFIIWLISGILCYIAVERIIKGHYKEVRPDEMLITASLGVLFNFIMAFVLHSEVCCSKAHSHQKFGHGHSHGGHGHSHGGHGHSHNGPGQVDSGHNHSHSDGVGCNNDQGQWNESLDHKDLLDVPDQVDGRSPATSDFNYHQLHQDSEFESSGHQMIDVLSSRGEDEEENLSRHKNINVRAAFIHVVGDIIQSLGVLSAALIIKFTEDEKYRLADPICTFLFSVLVLITTITILRDAMQVVMEGVPRDLSFDTLKKELKALDGVVAVHSLHIWALTLDRNSLAVHLVIENPEIQNQVLNTATKLLQDRYHFFHTTIQVDMYNQVMSDCHECLELN